MVRHARQDAGLTLPAYAFAAGIGDTYPAGKHRLQDGLAMAHSEAAPAFRELHHEAAFQRCGTGGGELLEMHRIMRQLNGGRFEGCEHARRATAIEMAARRRTAHDN